MKFLRDDDLGHLLSGGEAAFRSPVLAQVVSSDAYPSEPQNRAQKQIEARLIDRTDSIDWEQAVSGRRFFRAASGLAASFVAVNAVPREFFDAGPERINQSCGYIARPA